MIRDNKWWRFFMPGVALQVTLVAGNLVWMVFRLWGVRAPITKVKPLEYLAAVSILGLIAVLALLFDGMRYAAGYSEEKASSPGHFGDGSKTRSDRAERRGGDLGKDLVLRVFFHIAVSALSVFLALFFPGAWVGVFS